MENQTKKKESKKVLEMNVIIPIIVKKDVVETKKLRADGYNGVDEIYKNSIYSFNYSSGVRDIALETQSFWFLDVIDSYQNKLKSEGFQVWKLQRMFEYDNENNLIQKLDSFNVICDDGNNNELVKQIVEFSDFPDDDYIVWLIDGLLLLPQEY